MSTSFNGSCVYNRRPSSRPYFWEQQNRVPSIQRVMFTDCSSDAEPNALCQGAFCCPASIVKPCTPTADFAGTAMCFGCRGA
jgi:hypothetical protein